MLPRRRSRCRDDLKNVAKKLSGKELAVLESCSGMPAGPRVNDH